jgi:hypothetical protein
MRLVPRILAALISLSAASASGGDGYSDAQKLLGADAILLVKMTFDKPIPERWPNKECKRQGWAFPHALVYRAVRTATIEEVLLGPFEGKLPAWTGPTVGECWWWDVRKAGSAELIVFLVKSPAGWQQIQGVEGATVLHPESLALIKRVAQWRSLSKEKRIVAARAALAEKNSGVVSMAIASLCLDASTLVEGWARDAQVEHWEPEEIRSQCDSVQQIRREVVKEHGAPARSRQKM